MAKRKWPSRSKLSARGLAEGYRSGLEDKIGAELAAAGVKVGFEAVTLKYVVPERVARYTPDWVLPNGIVVESKGRFVSSDRKKHTLINEQFPDLDIRFVFSRSKDTIGKKSTTTYALWCDRTGIKWADKSIPQAWLDEPVNKASQKVLKRLMADKKDK